MSEDTLPIIAGLLYLLGAISFWDGTGAKEALLSMHAGRPIRMVPWQKSLGCAIWPLSILMILVGAIGVELDNGEKDDDRS